MIGTAPITPDAAIGGTDGVARREVGGPVAWIAGLGGLITAATYSDAASSGGGSYVVTTGMFIVGGINFFRGLYYWLKQNS